MEYLERRPAPPLSEYIDHLWWYRGYNPPHRRELVLPDGSIVLIIDLGDAPQHTYAGIDGRPCRRVTRAWLSGMHESFLVIEAAPGTMMGAYFRPGGFSRFTNLAVADLNNDVVEADRVWGRWLHEIRAALLDEPLPQNRLLRLEQALHERLVPPASSFNALAGVLDLGRTVAGLTVRSLAARAGYSERHLRRLFKQHVGLSPKTYLRVRRFWAAAQHLHASPHPDGSRIALESGYYDQAHFCSEFRALAGITPSEFLRRGSAYPNFVPIG